MSILPAEADNTRFPLRAIPGSVPVLATGLAVLGVLGLYWETAASIVAIWWKNQTFAHGFVVIPICLWLIWRCRDELARTPAKPWWPGLIAVFFCGALWLVMSAANVLGLKQFALAFMIQASVITVLGLRVARILAFPLVFLLFAIPAGEFLVPVLMDWTADFTVAAIRWSGVPVFREGNHFALPTGNWSIVEACSGIRYLVASVMVGTIYAALAYRSAGRRAAFLAASIAVPIVANWLRAYGIVMIGHLSNNQLAVGVDHLVYGWLFFGVVMLLLFWAGSFWHETPLQAEAQGPRAARPSSMGPSLRTELFLAAVAAIVAAGIWKPLEAAVDRPSNSIPILAPIGAREGWISAQGSVAGFKPHYLGAASELQQLFRKDGHEVGLYLAYYRDQEKGRELITWGNMLATPGDARWIQITSSSENLPWLDGSVTASRMEIAGASTFLDAFRLYWVNGRLTSSDYVAKALMAWSKITGQGDDSAVIVMYAPESSRGKGAGDILKEFATANASSIEQALAIARQSAR